MTTKAEGLYTPALGNSEVPEYATEATTKNGHIDGHITLPVALKLKQMQTGNKILTLTAIKLKL